MKILPFNRWQFAEVNSISQMESQSSACVIAFPIIDNQGGVVDNEPQLILSATDVTMTMGLH